ncbi:hypothetical protein RJT34_22880 [Clitoria ternatea]|uniref:WIYLD domain-containing protein n=1 Tax=Clitoria ternatea TaxID=43366 RepID=A0AAN9FN28_CLITE
MDAALDAMAPYGFPNKLVRTTVSQLLKVYGGKAGWVFIEDSAYTLLIDTLLQQQSNPSPEVFFSSHFRSIAYSPSNPLEQTQFSHNNLCAICVD